MDQYVLNDIVEYIIPKKCVKLIKNIEIFKYFKNNIVMETYAKYGWDKLTCTRAAKDGNIECIKYAHKNGCKWDKLTCAYASKNGHLKCLKYLHKNGCPWNKNTCINAASYGQLECLKYACENGCLINIKKCLLEAKGECKKYLEEHKKYLDIIGIELRKKFKIDKIYMNNTFMNNTFIVQIGNVEYLKYLHEKGYLLDRETCAIAAACGHLECLKYLHKIGCPWDEETCDYASQFEQLECLKYAYENKCPINVEECLREAEGECKEYLEKIGK
jgi:hypothetical protein